MAQRRGWLFTERAEKELATAWSFLPEVPRNGKMGPLIYADVEADGPGSPPREVTIFQHTYTTMVGSTPSQVAHSVYSLDAGPEWPDLSIHRRHRGLVGLLSNWRFTGRAVPTGDERFDERRFVLCRDEAFVRRLLTPELREHVLSKDGVMWRISHGRLCLIYRGRLRADRMERSVWRLVEFWRRCGSA